jgi:Clp amino terminal domain, pathogenicity island component
MMFERFTDTARHIVVQAQEEARRLGHGHIGCEHLLHAAAAAGEPAGAVLREHAVTPERVEAEILRMMGRGASADPLAGLDREALASIGIDLDAVRARIEARFGPDALARAVPACRRNRRPAWRKGPVAELMRRRRARRARRGATVPAGSAGPLPPPALPFQGPPPRGHIPFTPRAKKALELSLREAAALDDNYIGAQHITLALLAMKDGAVPPLLSAIGAPGASLRAAILDRYRKAS